MLMTQEAYHKEKYILITSLLEEGLDFREISAKLGVTHQAISQYCRRKQLKKKPKPEESPSNLQARKNAFALGPELYIPAAEKFRRKKQNVLSGRNGTKYEWNIEFEDIEWPRYCPILGLELLYLSPWDRKQEASVSFDRIDNTKGYVKGNVQIVSWRANRIKNDGTTEEHRLIYEHMFEHNYKR